MTYTSRDITVFGHYRAFSREIQYSAMTTLISDWPSGGAHAGVHRNNIYSYSWAESYARKRAGLSSHRERATALAVFIEAATHRAQGLYVTDKMMNPIRFRNSGITCHLLYGGGGVLPTKDAQLVPLDKDDWQSRRPLSFNAEGSLPNSQSELDEDMDIENDSQGSTSPPPSPTDNGPLDTLYLETQQLLNNLFREQAGGSKEAGGNQKALSTLRRVGAEINEKHKVAFQGMLQRLSIQTKDDIQKLSEVPSMVFSDGVTNWGRIVTLISFGAYVATHLKSIRLENCVGQLADNFTDYLMTQKREWIVQHNGWDGCVEFFHVEDYESGLRTVLMAFAGVAGLGASLAYMIR